MAMNTMVVQWLCTLLCTCDILIQLFSSISTGVKDLSVFNQLKLIVYLLVITNLNEVRVW